MGSLYETVVGVISKQPSHREEKEIQDLLPWFRKKSELFASLNIDVVTDIIRNCEFTTRERDFVIIRQGDIGDRFYIIIRGRVSIYINNAISDEDDLSKIAQRLHEEEVAAKSEKGKLDRAKFGTHIAYIEEGQSFGELALISRDCVRNASIIVEETSDLLEVDRELYNRSLHAAQKAEFEERSRFVANSPLFQFWAPKYKRMVAMSIRKQVVPFNESIIKQGEACHGLYFVTRGQAKLVVDPSCHRAQFPQLYSTDGDEEEQDKMAAPSVRPGERRKSIEISLIGENDIIGDVELSLDLKSYIQSVKCTSLVNAYSLDAKNYERLVVRRYPQTIELIREHAADKLYSRVKRSTDNQIPLLRTLLVKLDSSNKQPQQKKREPTHSAKIGASGRSSLEFPKGALVNLYGPGTVFHRIKQREKARRRAEHKAYSLRGASAGFGVKPAATLTSESREGISPGLPDRSRSLHDNYEDPFLNSQDTASIPPLDEAPRSYESGESSDQALCALEEKIRSWHAQAWDGRSKSAKPKTVKMRRVTLEEGINLKPGARVVFRKKVPQMQMDARNSTSDEDDPMKNGVSEDHKDIPDRNVHFDLQEKHIDADSSPEKVQPGRVPAAAQTAPESTAFHGINQLYVICAGYQHQNRPKSGHKRAASAHKPTISAHKPTVSAHKPTISAHKLQNNQERVSNEQTAVITFRKNAMKRSVGNEYAENNGDNIIQKKTVNFQAGVPTSNKVSHGYGSAIGNARQLNQNTKLILPSIKLDQKVH